MPKNQPEELWKLGQLSRRLRETRAETRRVWDDTAAREVTAKYLTPHESEEQKMRQQLGEQQTALEQAAERIASIQTLGIKAGKCSERMLKGLDEVGKHIKTAYGYYETGRRHLVAVRTTCEKVEALIAQANSACPA